jgi:ATP-binding cassette, subfamily F, member 3
MEEMQKAYPLMDNVEVRNALAAFLFYGDDVFKKISLLSGGEKGRLSLLLLMLGQGNFLLLDEPTNHLDMDSREMLEDALCEFDGTVLFVSHDRYFINKVANRVLDMKREKMTQYNGNWSDYLEFLEKQKNAVEVQEDGLTKTAQAKQKRADKNKAEELREAKKCIERTEREIERQEERLEEIETELAMPEGLSEETLISLSREHESVQGQIDELMKEWEEAHG